MYVQNFEKFFLKNVRAMVKGRDVLSLQTRRALPRDRITEKLLATGAVKPEAFLSRIVTNLFLKYKKIDYD